VTPRLGFLLYSEGKERTPPSRFASREAEGTGPVTPRQPAQILTNRVEQGAKPGGMPSVGRKEKD